MPVDEEQTSKVAVSRRHLNVAGSFAENANVAFVSCVGLGGPVIVITGGVVSDGGGATIVHVCVACGPTLPARSTARTRKVWPPSASGPG